MNNPPATREPVPARGPFAAAGTTLELRAARLCRAEAIVTDFVHYPDAVIADACQTILNHPGIDGRVFKRAEMTLQAIGGTL